MALAAVIVLSAYVSQHPFISQDAALERDVQSVPWWPLSLTFPFFTMIGDSRGFVAELIVFIVVLLVNRPAWVIAAGASVSALWYFTLSHLIIRPRPTTATVLQVTEHPGASSFPSGHTIFTTTLVVVIVLCIGYRYLRGWGRVAAWIVAAAVIAGNVIDRIDSGAHWPSDVLAGLLVATAWLAIWISIPWVYGRIASPARRSSSPSETQPSPRSPG